MLSALAHLALLGFVLTAPRGRSVARPQALSVELVSLPPGGAKARAAAPPAPAALPPKPKPKPKPKEVVLPAKPRGPVPKPRRREVFIEPQPKKAQEQGLEDLLAEMREDADEQPAAPVETAAAPAPGGAPGGGELVSAEVLDWVARTKRHVRRAWVVPPGFRTEPLETHVVITLDAAGNVIGTPRVARRSGNPWYDEGVVRGIAKASPLPPPPEPGDWDFIFVPEDSL